MLSDQQIKLIKKEHHGKTVKQLARQFKCPPELICKALALHDELRCLRIENIAGWISVFILGTTPLLVLPSLRDFSDLPQRVYIQFGMTFVILLLTTRMRLESRLCLRMHAISYLVVGFLCWSCLSFFWSTYFYGSLHVAIHWLACSVIFFVIINTFDSSIWIKRFLLSLSAGCAGVVIVGLGQVFFDVAWVPQVVPPAATFANANLAAEYVSLIVPIAAVLGVAALPRPGGWVMLIITSLAISYVYFAQGRAAMLAILCAFGWIGLLLLMKRARLICIMPGVVGGAILALTAVFAYVDSIDVNRWLGGSMAYRTVVWQNAMEMIRERTVLGFGVGNFSIFYPAYSRKAVADSVLDINKQIQRSHNDYIQVAVELGLVGCAMYLAMLVCGLCLAVRILHVNGLSKEEKVYALGSGGGIIAFIVTGFFSFPLQRSMPMLIAFCYFGILAAIYYRLSCKKEKLVFKVPSCTGALVLAIIATVGLAWTWSQYKNIACDQYYKLSLDSERSSSYKTAVAWGMKAHRYNRYRVDVQALLGKALLAEGQTDKAIEFLEAVIHAHPYNLNALIFLAGAYGNSGERDNALMTLKKILDIKPDFRRAQDFVYELKTKGGFKIRVR